MPPTRGGRGGGGVLGALGGDGPQRSVLVDLVPAGAADLSAAGRGEDVEPEGEFGAGPGAGGLHRRESGGDLGVGECSVVLYVVAVAGQCPHHRCGRVVGAVAFGDGPRHDGADAAFEFACGVSACLPDRCHEGEHVLGGDLGDGHVAEPRVGEAAQRVAPVVRGPPAVLAGWLVHGDRLLARLGEGRRGGVVAQRRQIAAAAGEFAVLEGLWRASARDVYG